MKSCSLAQLAISALMLSQGVMAVRLCGLSAGSTRTEETEMVPSHEISKESIDMLNTDDHYVIGFPNNLNTAQNGDKYLELQVSTPTDFTKYKISTPLKSERSRFDTSDTISRGSVDQIRLEHESFEVTDNTQRDRGILIQSNNSLIIHGLSYGRFTSEAFLALPCHNYDVTQYTYYAASFPMIREQATYKSQVLLVPCKDTTTIKITATQDVYIPADLVKRLPSGSKSFFKAGEQFTILLNQLETYKLDSFSDLTGTRIDSDKPLSVFSGHECADVPAGERFCDHLVEQIPPTFTWGRSFFSGSLQGRTSGEWYRVISSEELTEFHGTCTSPSSQSPDRFSYQMISAGNFQEFFISNGMFCSFYADKPVMVLQFAASELVDGRGDPSMSIIPPVEQYDTSYTWLGHSLYENFINLMIPAGVNGTRPDVMLDGSLINANVWHEILCSDGSTCAYGARLQVSNGMPHQVESSARLGAMAYGYVVARSYAYPAGMLLNQLYSYPTIELTASNENIYKNSRTVLTCSIPNLEMTSYDITWWKNGDIIGNSSTLETSDFGEYNCIISDGCGNYSETILVSEIADFTVNYTISDPSLCQSISGEDLLQDMIEVISLLYPDLTLNQDRYSIENPNCENNPPASLTLKGNFIYSSASGNVTASSIMGDIKQWISGRTVDIGGARLKVSSECSLLLDGEECAHVPVIVYTEIPTEMPTQTIPPLSNNEIEKNRNWLIVITVVIATLFLLLLLGIFMIILLLLLRRSHKMSKDDISQI